MLMMKKQRRRSNLSSESGLATVESLPLIVVFMVMFAFSLGSFGVIHSGILNSIAARNYAFETFRHRTNLVYLRTTPEIPGDRTKMPAIHYRDLQNRIHAVLSETRTARSDFPATERRIAMGMETNVLGRDNPTVHNTSVFQIQDGQQNTTVAANPVWLMTQYGICLTVACGD